MRTHRSAPEHDALLAQISAYLFGQRVATRWVPSDEADVFVLEGGDAAVVKIERPDLWVVRRERVVFPVLRGRGLVELPEVILTNDDLDDDVAAPFMVMPYTEHRPWPEIWHADERDAVWVVERIGAFLRRLAVIHAAEVPGASDASNMSPWFCDHLEPLRQTGDSEVRQLVDRCLAMMNEPPTGFGGWQYAQVLTDGRRTFTAIDWGNIGAFWPMADLAAAVIALARFDVRAVPVLRSVLLDSYTDGLPGRLGEHTEAFALWSAAWWLLSAASAIRRGNTTEASKLSAYAIDAGRGCGVG